MLADNVSSPFNEYLNLLIHFGVVGFIVVLILLGIVIIGYKKQPTEGKKIALFSLSGIGVFSMFSYPFSYPFIWIVSCLNFSFFCTGSFVCRIPYLWKKVCLSAVVLCSIVGIWKVTERIWAEVAWNKVAYISVPIKLTDYERLMDNFSGNPYFLYNYAVNLLQNNLLDESLHVAERCRMYWADYDLELLLGDLYGKKGKSDLAEWHYKKAARMCPCRFIPLYELMELYKQNGEHEKMREVIRLILNKPVKVDSSQVQFIKNRANSLWKFL